MNKKRGAAAAAVWAVTLPAAPPALAAGGHHAVEDAIILPRGECEQESWFSREDGGVRQLHAGLNCRVGPVELGVAGEHTRSDDPSETAWQVEVKWAHEVAENISIGFDLEPVWQAHQSPRFEGTRFAALATWTPTTTLALHVNLGRDFFRSGPDLPHHGVGLDWKPLPAWTLTGERFIEDSTHFFRAGVRWEAGRLWTIDISRAQRLSGPSPSNWTIGLSIDLDDD